MEERPNIGPFDPLLDVQGVKGPQDIFGNISSSSGADNPFSMGSSITTSSNLAYGGDPFAGDNFWNLFAGGVNPSDPFAHSSNTSNGF